MSTDPAAVCGDVGGAITCTAAIADQSNSPYSHGSSRLSAEPQGRIEVYNENIGGWGTVCGHWVSKNDEICF